MKTNYKPDYNGGSIVNLMSSIASRFGYRTGYQELKALPADRLRKANKVVLLVLDGLGYEYLIKHGGGSWIKENLITRMTSVFPSTTASAVTTYTTGLPPSRHAITGWYVYLKELGTISTILFHESRTGRAKLTESGVDPELIIGGRPFFDKIWAPSVVITPGFIGAGPVSKATRGKAACRTYENLPGLIKQIRQTTKRAKGEIFISAYWPEFDHLCHHCGLGSKKVKEHFGLLDRQVSRLWDSIKDTGTVLLVTADHGLTDTPKSKLIELKNHPGLAQCLTLPLSGEPRVVYCYVHPDRATQFKRYVARHLGHCCKMYTRAQLLANGIYGPGPADPRLAERIGDFVLLMDDGWCIKDFLPGEKKVYLKANHGGLTAQEMFVPLVALGLK